MGYEYEISKEIKITHPHDDWEYVFTVDEYGTVCITYNSSLESMTEECESIYIPKGCISHVINALVEMGR